MSDGYAPVKKDISLLLTTVKLYEQQLYMYETRTHFVEKRIVNIGQPWLHPIVRGNVGRRSAAPETGRCTDICEKQHKDLLIIEQLDCAVDSDKI